MLTLGLAMGLVLKAAGGAAAAVVHTRVAIDLHQHFGREAQRGESEGGADREVDRRSNGRPVGGLPESLADEGRRTSKGHGTDRPHDREGRQPYTRAACMAKDKSRHVGAIG